MQTTVSTFYKFVRIDDPQALKVELAAFGCRHAIKGTILIAHEGINATVCGRDLDVRALLTRLRSDARFADLVTKESYAEAPTFRRFKVKVKPEIVTFGHPEIDPVGDVGAYVAPENWNALIEEDGVIVVDTRNAYEYDVGTFKGAIDPKTANFREFAAFVDSALAEARDRKVAMFCTGGIRCEKATAYLRAKGFENVYHLEGGILKYLEVVKPEQSLWQGECFIFDERVALGHGVTPGHARLCLACGYPVRDAASAPHVCPKCGGTATVGAGGPT